MQRAIEYWPDKNYAHNKAQEVESSMKRSTRVRNKDCRFNNDQKNDCKGKHRRMSKKFFWK